MRILRVTTGVALALGIAGGAARAQNPPPPPQPVPQPAVLKPATAPPPPSPAAGRARGAAQAPTFAPIVAPARLGAPPDSVRPASGAPPAPPPANATARCRDGTYVVPPAVSGACTARGGLLVTIPQRAAPAIPANRVAAPVAAVAAAPASAGPPAGATMQCKDGSYLSGTPSGAACAGHGGLGAVLPAPRTAPTQPARVRRP